MLSAPMVSAGVSKAAQDDSVSALLYVISDPERAKRHLENIVAEKNAVLEATKIAREAEAEANEAKAEARNVRAGADAGVKELKRRVDAFNIDHAARTAALEDRHQALLAKDKRLTEYEAQVSAREKALGSALVDREKAVAAREAELDKREAAVRATKSDLAKIKADFETKLVKIKEAAQ